MDQNNRSQDDDNERNNTIRFAMGCLLVIVLGMSVLVISIVFMYIQSISTGSKEFFVK